MNKPCMAINHGLCVTAYGGLNPCCATHGDFDHLDNTSVVDYWKNLKDIKQLELNGGYIKECENCVVKERNGLISRKQKMNGWYKHIDKDWTIDNDGAIVHMDISFGNSCNQQCIMCNSRFSSKWLQEDIKLAEENSNLRHWDVFSLKNWSITYEQLDDIASLVTKETKRIEIKGGEPLYDKRFEYFVNKVLENNPNVSFSTNTNGTHFTDKNIEMLNRIYRLNIDVSYDGTGKVFEWIRSTKWDDAVQNWDNALTKLFHVPTINYTTSIYNLDYIQDMYEWVVKNANKYGTATPINYTQVVTSPKMQNPKYANKTRIRNALNQIEYIIDDPAEVCKGSSIYKPRLESLYNFLKDAYEYQITDNDIDNLKSMHHTMQKVRGYNYCDYTDL